MRRHPIDPASVNLKDALADYTVDNLKVLAATASRDRKRPTRKAELVDYLAGFLNGGQLRKTWSRLDELQQAAVAEAVHNTHGRHQAGSFAAKYGRGPDWGKADRYGYGLKSPSALGLFFHSRCLPLDLRKRLESFVPRPISAELSTLEELPEALETGEGESAQLRVVQTERAALQDLQSVLRLVEAGKLSVSDKTQLPAASATKAVSKVLYGGDFYLASEDEERKKECRWAHEVGSIKAFAWPLLVQAGRLAKARGKKLELTRAGQQALGGDDAQTIKGLWERWLSHGLLDELRRVDCIKGQTGKGKRSLTPPDERRDAIRDALAGCPVGRWLEIDELFRYMRAAGHDFEVLRDEGWSLYIADSHYGSLGYQGYHDWHVLQARYALCLLFEYAATLGLVDVGYVHPEGARADYEMWGTDDLEFLSRYDGLRYLRLTPLGAFAQGLSEQYAPAPTETQPALQVLPNLEVVASGEPLTPAETLLLDHHTHHVSERVWRLDRGTLLEAVEGGSTVAALRELLESRAAEALPETVLRFLADVEEGVGQVRDRGQARLIECATEVVAARLAGDTTLGRLCMRAGDRHLVVPLDVEKRFISALRKLGHIVSR